jgi:hypothetical protein
MSEVEFVNGLIVKKPHDNAPDFVKCGISINRKSLMEWLAGRGDEWINLQVKESKEGKWYAQVDTWKPKDKIDEVKAAIKDDGFDSDLSDLPF